MNKIILVAKMLIESSACAFIDATILGITRDANVELQALVCFAIFHLRTQSIIEICVYYDFFITKRQIILYRFKR